MIFYHNPRCSKSRKVKEILDESGHDYTEKLYLKEPPTKQELLTLRKMLGPVESFIRTGEDEFSKYSDKNLNDEQLIELIIAHPILLQRPIVMTEAKAIIGRPPEKVLELLK